MELYSFSKIYKIILKILGLASKAMENPWGKGMTFYLIASLMCNCFSSLHGCSGGQLKDEIYKGPRQKRETHRGIKRCGLKHLKI